MDRKPRRLGMGDLMILIAALGVGIWGARNLWQGLTVGPYKPSNWQATPGRLVIATFLSAVAAPMTLACFALRLRLPRPAWRRLFNQPGASACLACVLMFALRMLELPASFHAPVGGPAMEKAYRISVSPFSEIVLVDLRDLNGVVGNAQIGECFSVIVASFVYPSGYAVSAVWLMQALSGRWRPEKSWIDRLGRGLGVVWIVVMILAALHV